MAPIEETSSENKSFLSYYGLMVGISAGHGIKHFGQGALLVMAPFIKATLGIGSVAYGGIFTAQSVAAGIANVPAGIASDMYRKRVAWILATSMLMVGLGYLLTGLSPWYWFLIGSVVLIGFGTSLWHAPAFGTLAARYPERRGTAMAAHLTGAQIGNTLSPILIGFMLGGAIGSWQIGGIHWRWISVGLFIPMSATAILVLTLFKTAGVEATRNLTRAEYVDSALKLIHNFRVLGLVALGACRGAVHTSFQSFLVLYLTNELEYAPFVVGFHIALLTLAGILSTPLMGVISDKIGRKPVIVTAMGAMTGLLFLFLIFDTGVQLTLLVASLGMFFFSVMPIITASAMDQISKGSEGSATALMFTGGAIIGSLSPLVAGIIYDGSLGFSGVVIYSGIIAGFGFLLALLLPMRRRLNLSL